MMPAKPCSTVVLRSTAFSCRRRRDSSSCRTCIVTRLTSRNGFSKRASAPELARALPAVRIARPVRGHHQDDGVGRQLADRAEQLHAIDARHLDVGEDDVHVLARDDLAGRQAVIGR